MKLSRSTCRPTIEFCVLDLAKIHISEPKFAFTVTITAHNCRPIVIT
jgi:hypothetical protein